VARDDIRHCSAVIGITNGIKQSRIDHLPAPIFFGFALHRWRFRILDLHPMRRAPGAIGRAEPLANDALTTELAGFTEYNRTAACGHQFHSNAFRPNADWKHPAAYAILNIIGAHRHG